MISTFCIYGMPGLFFTFMIHSDGIGGACILFPAGC